MVNNLFTYDDNKEAKHGIKNFKNCFVNFVDTLGSCYDLSFTVWQDIVPLLVGLCGVEAIYFYRIFL